MAWNFDNMGALQRFWENILHQLSTFLLKLGGTHDWATNLAGVYTHAPLPFTAA